jgi:hypothetical protein
MLADGYILFLIALPYLARLSLSLRQLNNQPHFQQLDRQSPQLRKYWALLSETERVLLPLNAKPQPMNR